MNVPNHWLAAQKLAKEVFSMLKEDYSFEQIKNLKDDRKVPFFKVSYEVPHVREIIRASFYKTERHADEGYSISLPNDVYYFQDVSRKLSHYVTIYVDSKALKNEQQLDRRMMHLMIHEFTHAFQRVGKVFDESFYKRIFGSSKEENFFLYLTSVFEIDAELSAYYNENNNLLDMNRDNFMNFIKEGYEKNFSLSKSLSDSVVRFITKFLDEKMDYYKVLDLRGNLLSKLL